MSARLEQIILESKLEPASCVLRNVTRTSRLVVATFDAAFSSVGLTGQQFNVLMTVARSGPMNVNRLAILVGMHPSTTPRLLGPLKRKSLVSIKQGADRRERVIAVTHKGYVKLLRAFPCWSKVQGKILTQLGEQEWSSAMKALKNIRSSLRAAGAPS